MRFIVIISIFILVSCKTDTDIEKFGHHYQKYKDYESLKIVTELIPKNSDTSYVIKILGKPTANFGFDYRYLIDSIGVNGCQVGAVFGIDDKGKISWKEVMEICE